MIESIRDTKLNLVKVQNSALVRKGSATLASRGLGDLKLMEDGDSLFQRAKELRAKGELKQSHEYLLRTVAQNPLHSEALFWLGWAYLTGWAFEGVGDPHEAENAFKKSALQGNTFSQNNLGVVLLEAVEWGPEDESAQPRISEAEHWLRQAAEHGLDKAQYNLGRLYEQFAFEEQMETNACAPQDNTEAEPWYRKAAVQGLAEAQYALGKLLKDQAPSPEEDRDRVHEADNPMLHLEAANWLYKAALQNHPEAQYELGRVIETGYPVCMIDGSLSFTPSKYLPDKLPLSRLREANRWILMAAEQGYYVAQNHLGVNFASGWGARRNMKEALQWLRKATLQGHGSAFSRLKSFADTPECESLYPNKSLEERLEIIDEERRIAIAPDVKRNQKRQMELRGIRMYALPEIAQ